MSVDSYIERLDLSPDGDIGNDLISRVQREARFGEIWLTALRDADAHTPPFLTGEMAQWYRSRISGQRVQALAELEAQFRNIQTRHGQEALFVEAEMDRHAQEKWARIRAESSQYLESEDARKLASDLADAQRSYERKRAANGGEESRAWARYKYVGWLSAIAIPELFLNFQSSMRTIGLAGLNSPALAAGLTVLLALGIAFSSHVIGVCIHQWGDRFGGDVGRKDKLHSLRFFAIGWVIFTVAIGIVTYGRYLLFADDLERAILMGRTTTGGALLQVGYTVGGNVLVWLMGIVISMFAHDKVDGLGETKRAYDLAHKRYAAHRKELEERNERHINLEQSRNTKLRELEKREFQALPEYVALRRRVEDISAKDNGVLALLEGYRLALLGLVQESGARTVFMIDDEQSARSREMSPREFGARKLYLPCA
ncbi:hypothetical protein [Bauldia litoralis]|uniref:hypothetical protein n=1 Tax=Bauldia litoralis TaxID=665467 RepID=UPI003265FB22